VSEDKELAYAQRFEAVFDYIERHLGDALDTEQLSRVAHFSKFHFHRQFSLYAGISISAYVRMVVAARQLPAGVPKARAHNGHRAGGGLRESRVVFARVPAGVRAVSFTVPQTPAMAAVERAILPAAQNKEREDGCEDSQFQ